MATIHCPCGHRISDNTDPNPNKSFLISDKHSEQLAEEIIETCDLDDKEARSDQINFLVVNSGQDVFVCPECKRLLIFDGTNLVNTYTLEKS